MPIVYRPGLTCSEVNAIESTCEVVLPEPYRRLLMRMNGFHIAAPDHVQLRLSAVEAGEISFDRLFGVRAAARCNDLISFNKEFIDELDFIEGAFAIGEDGGGNPFVWIADPQARGVYYWDRTHLHAFDDPNEFDIAEQEESGPLYKVADDVDAFYKLILSALGARVDFIEDV
ncbi:SMI1/KNR4 family protein [Enterobacterales bacterium AW_CKDN230030176-1A_HGKHYDSX7]